MYFVIHEGKFEVNIVLTFRVLLSSAFGWILDSCDGSFRVSVGREHVFKVLLVFVFVFLS